RAAARMRPASRDQPHRHSPRGGGSAWAVGSFSRLRSLAILRMILSMMPTARSEYSVSAFEQEETERTEEIKELTSSNGILRSLRFLLFKLTIWHLPRACVEFSSVGCSSATEKTRNPDHVYCDCHSAHSYRRSCRRDSGPQEKNRSDHSRPLLPGR